MTPPADALPIHYRFADLTLDVARRRVTRAGQPIELKALDFDLLRFLVESAPNVVNTDVLAEKVWGRHFVSPENVAQRVMLLRQSLSDDANKPRYVETVRNKGYRLIPPVEKVPAARGGAMRRDRHWGPIAAALLLAIGVTAAAGYWFGGTARPPPNPTSIAVLPFENLSSDPDDAYFAASMQEEIVSRLVKIGGLRVFRVRPGTDARESVAEVVRGLNVATVLGGTVHHAEGFVRVNLQLTRAATTESLWSDSYVREQSGIFAIQSEIALDVARALSIELSAIERRRIERVPTTDPGARELYLRALARLGRDTREQVLTAIDEVERALAYDDDFAEAWALDAAFHGIASFLDSENAVEHTQRVEKAANRALALDDELAAAHTALGGVALARRDWIGAEAAFRRAAALDPGSGPGPGVTLQLSVGNFARARDLTEQTRVAEPQNPTNYRLLAYSYAVLGDWETASALYESGTLLFGDDANVVDAFQRMINDELHWFVARKEIAKARALPLTDSLDIALLASIDEPKQARVQLQQAFAGTSRGNPRLRRNIAIWAGHFEDPVLALKAMRAAIDEQVGSTAFLWYPQLDAMRQLPEFKEYLQKIGIVDYWKEYGWPDICHPLGKDDFECDPRRRNEANDESR